MTLDNDPRTGKVDSGTVTFDDATGTTPQTAFQIPDNALFRVTKVKVEYDDGATTGGVNLEMYDDADGTGNADVADKRDEFKNLDTDTLNEFDGPWRVFEEDVLFHDADDNIDGELQVSVYGVVLSDLKDMVSF